MPYIITYLRAPEPVAKRWFDTMRRYQQPTIHFAAHLLNSSRMKRYLDGWVPIPYESMQEKWGERNTSTIWSPLYDDELIEYQDYSEGRCRYFRPTQDLIDLSCGDILPANILQDSSWFNLVDGKRIKRRSRNIKYDRESRKDHPRKVTDPMDHIGGCPIHIDATYKFLKDTYSSASGAGLARRAIDQAAYENVIANRLGDAVDGILIYQPSYEVCTTGRIFETGGGLQSCTNQMKAIAAQGLNNYDIRSSQVYVLMEDYQRRGLDAEPLRRHLAQPKDYYPRLIGIDIDVWKPCRISHFFGSPLKNSPAQAKKTAIGRHLLEQPGTEEDFKRRYIQLKTVLKELEIEKWHQELQEELENTRPKRGGHRSQLNACDMRFDVPDEIDAETIRKYGAHVLQGFESRYIHELTRLSRQYGYQVAGNQHDGLLTIGEIPPEAQAEASRLSGFTTARLEIKPLAG